ncbi:SDR family NAD(P)-dependent oxidoreductase [Chloroflexota bacterium]
MRLKDKVCVISGAGSGIGREASLLFAREGAKIVVSDIKTEAGEETVDMVKASGGDAAFVPADVSKAAEVEKMIRFAAEKYGKINVLYNNAGFFSKKDRLIVELEEEIWDKAMTINLKGTYLCCKYGIPELIKSGGGAIINVGSAAALVGIEFPAYSATKGGIVSLTRTVARQYANKGIRANVICPGQTATAMYKETVEARQERGPEFPYQPILLGRMGKPEEIAHLALYLASDESAWVTGATFVIDGGWTAV